jgi:hypothetical protein
MNPGDNRARKFKYIKINCLIRVIYLMLNLVRRSFILYPTADYD